MDKKEFKKLKDLESFLKETGKIIDPKIKEVLGIYVDKKTQKLLNYQIEVGGKKLRPGLAKRNTDSDHWRVIKNHVSEIFSQALNIRILNVVKEKQYYG